MKTERRHELGENTLARELNTWGDRMRPYTSAILAIVAALLGVYIVASLWNSYRATRDRAAWDDYQLAVFQDDYEHKSLQRLAVSEDHEGTDMQEWAMIGWADRQLRRAAELYFVNRDEANDRVTDVIGIYEGLADNSSHPEIRNRAQLGLARAYEIKNDLKQARVHYERVEGALSTVAQQRSQQLESKQVEESANWLATVELPKPSTPTGPGTPGSRPGFEATAPLTDPAGASGAAASSMSEIFGGLEALDPSRYDAAGSTAIDAAGAGEATDAATDGAAADAPSETPAGETEPSSETPADGESGADAPAAPAEVTPPTTEQPAADATTAEPSADAAAADEAEQPAAAAPAEQ